MVTLSYLKSNGIIWNEKKREEFTVECVKFLAYGIYFETRFNSMCFFSLDNSWCEQIVVEMYVANYIESNNNEQTHTISIIATKM